MKQYPHKLLVKSIETGLYEDYAECRSEPNGSGKAIQGVDNVAYVFSAMIYLPVGVDRLLIGQEIKVTDEFGEQRIKGKVARFTNDHFHSRLWV